MRLSVFPIKPNKRRYGNGDNSGAQYERLRLLIVLARNYLSLIGM
jgi:hypothetical protein